MENNNINTTSSEPVAWPTNTDLAKKKKKLKIVYLVLAVLLTVGSALGSFYLSRNLNQASTPNAPASEPQAAQRWVRGADGVVRDSGKPGEKSSEAIKSWNGGDDCEKGCGANEYCEDGRCRKSGGSGDARSPLQQQLGYGTQLVVSPTKPPLSSYVCTEENCPGPEFHCAGSNNCLPSKGYCRGTLCNGTCVGSGNTWVCQEGVYGLPGGTTAGDINNCGGSKCAIGFQYCDATTNECVGIPGIGGVDKCDGIAPDIAGVQSCCVLKGVGVYSDESMTNTTNPVPDGSIPGEVDQRTHWTNCASGTTCRQGVGCIGPGERVADTVREAGQTSVVATTTITTTTTIRPTVTTTPTATPTATITVTVTATPSATITVKPTVAVCNESCTKDDDCANGLFCDSESNKCRKSECSSEKDCSCPEVTPEPTIVGCNYKCKTDDNCSGGLICDSDSGRCRKAVCSDEKDCSCPKPHKTDAPTREATTRRTTTRIVAQPTVLKEAGILDLPGVAVFGSGLILTVIGILLAL